MAEEKDYPQFNDDIPCLSSEQANNLVELVKAQMGETIVSTVNKYFNMNQFIRFLFVSKFFEKKRKEFNLSLKDVSSKIKVPQYRVEAIENARLSEIQSEALKKYASLLGLEKGFEQWSAQNADIIEEISNL